MLTEICAEIRNYFPVEVREGEFVISGGSIAPLDFLKEGQYFRIVGSIFNDGVHQHPTSDLTDEVFHGAVWSMALPPAFIDLAADIKKYADSDAAQPTAYTSESFGGYSYTKAHSENGAAMNDWQSVFGKRLNKWRKM